MLIAQRLDPEIYGGRRVEDVRAVAWVHLGNAFRIAALQLPQESQTQMVAETADEPEDGAYPVGAIPPNVLRETPDPLVEIEAALRETRDAFLDRGMAYDAALVTLDLVAAYRQAGRADQVARLAREAVDLLAARGAPAYALDALRFLRAAAEGAGPEPLGDLVPESVLDRIARLLRRKRGSSETGFP